MSFRQGDNVTPPPPPPPPQNKPLKSPPSTYLLISQEVNKIRLIEYNMRSIFPEKSYAKYGGETISSVHLIQKSTVL